MAALRAAGINDRLMSAANLVRCCVTLLPSQDSTTCNAIALPADPFLAFLDCTAVTSS